jgi:hypothetical protein
LSQTTKLCPSAPGKEGALLFGVVQADGSVAYLKDPLSVTSEFVELARPGRSPGTRFRFASPCLKGACAQWAGNRCGLPERLGAVVHDSAALSLVQSGGCRSVSSLPIGRHGEPA